MNEKWKDLLRNYVGYVAVFLISAFYVCMSFVEITETHKSVARILADGVVAFMVGVMINRVFETQGILNGERDGRVMSASRLHNEIVDRVIPQFDRLEAWCEQKNRETQVRVRRQYLSLCGERYEDYFDEDGLPKSFSSRPSRTLRGKAAEWKRRFRYNRAVTLPLTQLCAALLISDAGDARDPYYMGRSKREYVRQSSKADVVTKLLTAFLFGYYGVTLIHEFSAAALIWTLFQVGVFLAMGVLRMQSSQIYVTDEYRGRINKKIDVLQQFETDLKKEGIFDGKENEGAD